MNFKRVGETLFEASFSHEEAKIMCVDGSELQDKVFLAIVNWASLNNIRLPAGLISLKLLSNESGVRALLEAGLPAPKDFMLSDICKGVKFDPFSYEIDYPYKTQILIQANTLDNILESKEFLRKCNSPIGYDVLYKYKDKFFWRFYLNSKEVRDIVLNLLLELVDIEIISDENLFWALDEYGKECKFCDGLYESDL